MADATTISRSWLAIGYGLVVAIIALSVTPAPPVEMGGGRDKFYHALAYGTLMLWFVQGHPRQRWPVIAAACLTLGVVLEYVQGWTGIRTFGYDDMLGDAAGIGLAWLAAHGGVNDGVARLTRYLTDRPRRER
jgi:hypothetical protein